MVAANRTGLWGFIILLAALAFLRSLAPEHTERAVLGLMKTTSTPRKDVDEEMRKLKDMKDELKRERIALEKLKDELEENNDQEEEAQQAEEKSNTSDDLEVIDSSTETETVSNDEIEEKREEHVEESANIADGSSTEQTYRENENADGEGKQETEDEEAYNSDHDVEPVQLADDECPVVVVPEYSKSGLGTQIEHVWTSLSVTLAVRNACVVLPPVVTDIGEEDVEIVPFHEVFDLDELGRTGLRILPLSICNAPGVSHVFDDNGAESAIVKNFVSYVERSHPSLAERNALVHENTQAHRFPPIEETEGDVNRVATYIASKRGKGQGRECIGFGRMRSAIAFNGDVVEHFQSAKGINDFVSSRYPRMNETLFVKLRWNKAHCDEKRNEDGTVCILSGEILPTEDYVNSIAFAASTVGASKIYISAPPYVPPEVSDFISSKLMPADPVVLDVGSDFFTAGVVEREMAVRSRAFVPDGGAWGESVQEARRMHSPHLFKEGWNSVVMVEEWRNAGSPTELPIIMASYNHENNTEWERPDPAVDDQSSPSKIAPEGDQPQSDPQSTENSEKEEGSPDSGNMDAVTLQPMPENVNEDGKSDPDTANAVLAQPEAERETNEANVGTEMEPGLEVENGMPEKDEQDIAPKPADITQEPVPGTVPGGLSAEDGEQRPEEYEPPQAYMPNTETDHHLFPDGQIPAREVIQEPGAAAEEEGEAADDTNQEPSVRAVQIRSGTGISDLPRQRSKSEQKT
ncbi:unnamed protein product [Agarophyton chilense]|eukprot:gb/GEZJ01003829.1/.p1 GENE.gb/GEZJ01003829.1/~~gb/GEZJ01003829.1/.p1  ORF type:complete len:749 (+),score=145.42 gb/GEZJ01003829.1/:431-2677(+)